LPTLATPVVLVDQDGHEHRSQVEAVDGLQLTVTGPAGLISGEPLLVGDALTLRWTQGGADSSAVPARLAAKRSDGPDRRLWDLELVGPVRQEQRRDHERIRVAGPVRFTQLRGALSGVQARTATGELLDVSEVGARCSLDAGAVWAARHNAAVQAEFELSDRSLDVTGRVLSSSVSTSDPSRRELVMIFDQRIPDWGELAATLRGDGRA
jgi:hypothetical protein